jgi:hypothetical protein
MLSMAPSDTLALTLYWCSDAIAYNIPSTHIRTLCGDMIVPVTTEVKPTRLAPDTAELAGRSANIHIGVIHNQMKPIKHLADDLIRGDNNLTPMLTAREVAALTHLGITTINRRRALNLKPDFIRVGGAIRYPRKAVIDWLASLGAK